MTASPVGRSDERPIVLIILGQEVELAYTSTIYSHRDGCEYPDQEQTPSPGALALVETLLLHRAIQSSETKKSR